MTAEWVTAVGAVATALVALGALLFARGQVKEARMLREEQAQPYVVAYLELSGTGGTPVDLVVKNFGKTAAHDVRISATPVLQRSPSDGSPSIDDHLEVWLPESISILVPGQEWRTFWDIGTERAKAGLPNRHTLSVAYQDSRKREYKESIELDWGQYLGTMSVTVYGQHHLAKATREISETIKGWNEGATGSLNVYVRDGDSKDARIIESRNPSGGDLTGQ